MADTDAPAQVPEPTPRAGRWVYADRRLLSVLLLGFSSGLPLALSSGTLSAWLKEAGVNKATIGLFALVGLPYTLKFIWSPLLDRIRLPFLGPRLGRRRGWMLLTQLALASAILLAAGVDPSRRPALMALAALFIAFTSASQDIVIDAWRVEALRPEQQGAGAGVVVLGYRLGMLAAGAGALYLASAFGWRGAYLTMAGLMLLGVVTTLLSPEPEAPAEAAARPGLAAWLERAVWEPLKDFSTHRGWGAILLFVMLYKIGDSLVGVMANPFYLEMGFTKPEIASVSKVFGLVATLTGGLIGGSLVGRLGLNRSLLLCGVFQTVSYLSFAGLARAGHDIRALIATIAIENLATGMGMAAFTAYVSSLCRVAYTATQFALLSSLAAIGRNVLAAGGGWLANELGWTAYFVFTSVAALPGLALLIWLIRRSPQAEQAAG